MAAANELLVDLPRGPGVYLFFDASERLLYVGKSIRIRERVQSYFREDGGHSRRTSRLKLEIARIESVPCGSELEAMLLEGQLIRTRMPLYNVRGRRSRHYPFIRIIDQPWPRVEVTYEIQEGEGRYFGPFLGEHFVREILDALRPLFRWRSCFPLASRACFEHTTGRCSAPCVGAVAAEQYEAQIEELASLLAGLDDSPLRRLEDDMHRAAQALQFERAAILRDRLTLLRPWWERRRGMLSVIAELEILIVLPGVEKGTSVWLLVRRGRLVHTEATARPSRAKELETILFTALQSPPPSLAVQQNELDQINLLVAWLHRHRDDGCCVNLSGRSFDDSMSEAWRIARRYENALPENQADDLADIKER
ncbi:MAG: UvrB/UvrC motif-containing protein [Candidatus Sericytochromatia bacterium]|nr:UvrB/UvrC motif-containing protein [Candidatus Sericytochromatia bacterium]